MYRVVDLFSCTLFDRASSRPCAFLVRCTQNTTLRVVEFDWGDTLSNLGDSAAQTLNPIEFVTGIYGLIKDFGGTFLAIFNPISYVRRMIGEHLYNQMYCYSRLPYEWKNNLGVYKGFNLRVANGVRLFRYSRLSVVRCS